MHQPRHYALSPVFEQLLRQRCGLGTDVSGSALARLADCTKKLADAYTDGEPARAALSDPSLRAAYTAYYLPCNAVKLFPVLEEIERRSPLLRANTELRVLDLGCGPGTLTAALLDYCLQNRAGAGISLDITGIDRNPGNTEAARELTGALCAAASGALKQACLRFLSGDLTSAADMLPEPQTGFDLIMAGNLVNELDSSHITGFARLLASRLAPGGMAVVLEPGTLPAFRRLLLLRQELAAHADISLRAPCLRPGPCPLQDSPETWCHEKLFWSPPALVSLIDERTGFTKRKGVKFSYIVAARDKDKAPEASAGPPDKALWRIVSYVIRSKGEERLYACNGRERILLRRLTRLKAPASADFSHCARGDIVVISGAEQRKNFYNIGPQAVFRTVD